MRIRGADGHHRILQLDAAPLRAITSAEEVAAIEAGAAGPGWQKTGKTLFAHTEANDAAGLVPVCRFYGSISPGPNSHFFTADPDECAAVKTDPGWH